VLSRDRWSPFKRASRRPERSCLSKDPRQEIHHVPRDGEAAAEEARWKAAALWKDLKTMKPVQWRLAAVFAPELRRWAFVKLVGEESARAASVDAGRALELASFALWVAERVSGAEGWMSRVFAWAFLANARRVRGDLAGAEEASACSARLQADPPEGLPEPWRLFDLEASLRIDLPRKTCAMTKRRPASIWPGCRRPRSSGWCAR
jgi:hypothetical protein